MINLPNDYDSAKSFNGGSGVPLTVGPHMCRIRGARLEKAMTGKDMLVIAFDISEPGDFYEYFAGVFNRRRKYNADAKWPGIFRTSITNSEGNTNGFFKGFIEAVEASNGGYSFKGSGCNEATLNGKLVGFNFGEKEYVDQSTGEIKTTVQPFYAVSSSDINSGAVVPPPKKLHNGSTSSTSRVSAPVPPREQCHQTTMAEQGFTQVDDDGLPF